MDEKIGKPAFKSPPEPENVGGIIAATRSAVQIIESVSLQLYLRGGLEGRVGGDKGLLATKPVPSLATGGTQPL